MVEISCFYIHFNREPVHFTFVKYKKYIKISINHKSMIIEISKLKNYISLFDIYILSLLCTEDVTKIEKRFNIDDKRNEYGIKTQQLWKCMYYTDYHEIVRLEINSHHNPLLSKEPIRETSLKKQRKFIKQLKNYYYNSHIIYSLDAIDMYLRTIVSRETEITNKVIEYETKIHLLCCIRGFNKDIYMNIMKFI